MDVPCAECSVVYKLCVMAVHDMHMIIYSKALRGMFEKIALIQLGKAMRRSHRCDLPLDIQKSSTDYS